MDMMQTIDYIVGGVGTVAILYLRQIANTMCVQVELVRDIDKRVVAVETKLDGHLEVKL